MFSKLIDVTLSKNVLLLLVPSSMPNAVWRDNFRYYIKFLGGGGEKCQDHDDLGPKICQKLITLKCGCTPIIMCLNINTDTAFNLHSLSGLSCFILISFTLSLHLSFQVRKHLNTPQIPSLPHTQLTLRFLTTSSLV